MKGWPEVCAAGAVVGDSVPLGEPSEEVAELDAGRDLWSDDAIACTGTVGEKVAAEDALLKIPVPPLPRMQGWGRSA